jgi:hypothetical protein
MKPTGKLGLLPTENHALWVAIASAAQFVASYACWRFNTAIRSMNSVQLVAESGTLAKL